jgi:hypothetical protein
MERELAFSLFPSFLLNDRTTNLGKNTPSQPRFFFQEVLFFLFSPQQNKRKNNNNKLSLSLSRGEAGSERRGKKGSLG